MFGQLACDESGGDVSCCVDGGARHEGSGFVTEPAQHPAGRELHRDDRPQADVDQQQNQMGNEEY